MKSRGFLNPSIPVSTGRRIHRILAIPEGTLPFTYLGVPIAPRKAIFQPLADRILSKFSRWKGSSLSMADLPRGICDHELICPFYSDLEVAGNPC